MVERFLRIRVEPAMAGRTRTRVVMDIKTLILTALVAAIAFFSRGRESAPQQAPAESR